MMADIDDELLLQAHDNIDTDSLDETIEMALRLTADLENADEMVDEIRPLIDREVFQ